jgi:putative phage-type endonuclease
MTPELPAAWLPFVAKDAEPAPAAQRATPPRPRVSGLTPEQLAMRLTGIGGSEIGAILGESRFSTPFDVWLSKTQGWVQAETEDMRRGTFLEDGIARWYADRFGIAPERLQECGTIRHKTRPVALCTPDRIVVTPERDRLVSIKVPRRKGEAWGDPGTDNVPPEYLLQMQWEHAIYSSPGLYADDEMHLAALIDGDLAVYITRADRELQAWMLDFAEEWWARHVVGGEHPSMEGSERAKAWLAGRFPKDNGTTRPAEPHEISLMVQLELAEAEAERTASEKEHLGNQLRQSMGETTRIDAPNGYATWKTDKRGHKTLRTKFTNKEK